MCHNALYNSVEVVNSFLSIVHSIWSAADHLYDAITTHWTGSPIKLGGMIRIDSKVYRYSSSSSSTTTINIHLG